MNGCTIKKSITGGNVMLKRIVYLFLALAFVFCTVACGNTEADSTDSDEAEEVFSYFSIDGYGNMISHKWNGEPSETQGFSMEGIVGGTVGETMEESSYEDIQPIEDADTFEGWMKYKVIRTEGEDGFDEFEYEKMSSELMTTEEMLQDELGEFEVAYVAKWASIAEEDYFVEEDFMWTDTSSAVAFIANGGMMMFRDFEGEEYESFEFFYWVESGQSVNDIVENQVEGYAEMLSIEQEGKTFAGWAVYECDEITWSAEEGTEDGDMTFETENSDPEFKYIVLKNASTYNESATTEEAEGIVCDGKSYYVVANWE